MKKAKKIKRINISVLKGKNKRIQIELCEDSEKKFFVLYTKTLIDFKARHILETHNSYSIESFFAIQELSEWFINHPKIKNKEILKELNQMQKFTLYTDLK